MSVMISDSTIQSIRDFVAERGWGQYHTPENLAKSISIEAAAVRDDFEEYEHRHLNARKTDDDAQASPSM